PQLVVELVDGGGLAAELPLHLLDGVAVEEVAQLLLPEQLAEQVAVERQRLRPPFRRRRVVLVHVGRDVVEEQRRRVRGGAARLHLDEVELARLQSLQHGPQSREVEDVLQALAVRLEDDGEAAVLARNLEERLCLQPLLPQGRPLTGAAARDEKRTCRVLAEAGAEERGLPHLADDEVLHLGGVDEQILRRRRRVRL